MLNNRASLVSRIYRSYFMPVTGSVSASLVSVGNPMIKQVGLIVDLVRMP